MAPADRRRIKRESTVVFGGGLATPNESFYGAGIATPKREEIDLDSVSDVLEDPFQGTSSFQQHHGLPGEDEGYASLVAEQARRSVSVSVRTSRPPSSHNVEPQPQPEMSSASGLALVGRDTKRLIDTIDKLRKIGLKSIDAKLPELVLVGDQSAGKSSLMGAIAEINLPKGSGMCTKCPSNIKTSHAVSWGCAVSLQLTHTFQPTPRKPPKQEFQNWPERDDVATVPFKTIHNKAELEDVLKWAQIALLNPSEDIESFIPGTPEHADRIRRQESYSDEAKFSPNVIAVEISGPGLPDLSFFDLPGLFSAPPNKEQEYLVTAFDAMTSRYIKHENALIICAITMQNDPGLSKTKAIISKHKADDRCIGVLTMPDRLQSDSAHKDYDKILNEQAYVLSPHGYFVTKQPGANTKLCGPGYHFDARKEEERFFDTDRLWAPGGAWSQFRASRCGTGNIQEYLSRQFAALIMKSIPDITEKIRLQLAQVDEELSCLPETPNDKVQHIVRQHLSKFSQVAQQLLDRSYASQNHAFHGDWKELCDQFQKAIEFMRPGCVLATPNTEKVVINIDVSDDDEASHRSYSITPKRSRDADSESPVAKRHRQNLFTTPNRTVSHRDANFSGNEIKREVGQNKLANPHVHSVGYSRIKQSEFGPFYNKYLDIGWRALSLIEIRQQIAIQGLAGVPEFVNHKVRQNFALNSINPWKYPLETFIDNTFDLLRSSLVSALRKILGSYEQTSFFRTAKQILENFLKQQEAEQRAISMAFYASESVELFTVNEEDFLRHKAEALELLKDQRRKLRVISYAEKHFQKKGKPTDQAAYEEFKTKITDAQLGPDTFDRELEVASYIRGYYTTARLRFVDSVCANMNARYFRKIKTDVVYLLENELGLDRGDGEATCQRLLEGNAEISKKRTALQKKRKQLVEFSRVLDQLNNGIDDDNYHHIEENIENGHVTQDEDHKNSRRSSDDVHMNDLNEHDNEVESGGTMETSINLDDTKM